MDIANLYEEDTEIAGRVFVTSAYGNLKHRLKYIVDGVDMFVSIENNPKLLSLKSMVGTIPAYFKNIADWIKINMAYLLEFWSDPEMSTFKIAKILKSVNGTNLVKQSLSKEGIDSSIN